MSTTLVTKEQAAAARKWYVLDAAGKPMGKTAALAADLLRGKLKTDYTPHVDCGDYVIIINAKDAVLTGKKLEQKYYRTHSGYPGGLKETQYKTLMEKKPDLCVLPSAACCRRTPSPSGSSSVFASSPALSTPTPPRSPKSGISKEVNEYGNL